MSNARVLKYLKEKAWQICKMAKDRREKRNGHSTHLAKTKRTNYYWKLKYSLRKGKRKHVAV